jgi:hypothetical protein
VLASGRGLPYIGHMPARPANLGRRRKRPVRIPPHVPIKALRLVACISQDELADRIFEITGKRPTKGSLSAIESGLRGPSVELIAALEEAYGLNPGTISTTYRPRAAQRDSESAA